LNGARFLPWLESYDLSTPSGIELFLKELVKAGWTGTLGSRSIGALNGSLRLLLEHMTLPALEKRIEILERQETQRNE
jgi:predicted TIM-barrel enzyme